MTHIRRQRMSMFYHVRGLDFQNKPQLMLPWCLLLDCLVVMIPAIIGVYR